VTPPLVGKLLGVTLAMVGSEYAKLWLVSKTFACGSFKVILIGNAEKKSVWQNFG
jgi:hypothetical protein